MGTTVNTKYSLYKYGPGFDGNECIAFQLPSRNRCKIEAKKAGLKEGEYFIHEQEYYTTNRGTYVKGEQDEEQKEAEKV
jgi:hypothetical protein